MLAIRTFNQASLVYRSFEVTKDNVKQTKTTHIFYGASVAKIFDRTTQAYKHLIIFNDGNFSIHTASDIKVALTYKQLQDQQKDYFEKV